MIAEAKRWVEQLDLNAHPEGGYYKRLLRMKVAHQNVLLIRVFIFF